MTERAFEYLKDASREAEHMLYVTTLSLTQRGVTINMRRPSGMTTATHELSWPALVSAKSNPIINAMNQMIVRCNKASVL